MTNPYNVHGYDGSNDTSMSAIGDAARQHERDMQYEAKARERRNKIVAHWPHAPNTLYGLMQHNPELANFLETLIPQE